MLRRICKLSSRGRHFSSWGVLDSLQKVNANANILKEEAVDQATDQFIKTLNQSVKKVDRNLKVNDGDQVKIVATMNLGVFSLTAEIQQEPYTIN